MRPKKKAKNSFVFKKHANIGAVTAEDDQHYLDDCFVESGDLETLVNCKDPKRIIIGRTGVGKSALLYQLSKSQTNVIEIQPESLALNFISNSTIIKFFEDLGVDLSLFYTFLWQHVFTVELIKYKYNLKDENRKKSFMEKISHKFHNDSSKKQAIKYLEEWGGHFWEETECRVKEFTTKLENDLNVAFKAAVGKTFSGEISNNNKISEEIKGSLITHATKVINQVQIKDLHCLINLLDSDIFDDKQNAHYLVIDRLDEKWVSDAIKLKLIRALIESTRRFKSVTNVKIIIALRIDLIEKVFIETRDSGFQEEKYHSLHLRLKWDNQELKSLVGKRVQKLIKDQYTNYQVTLSDILPATKLDGHLLWDYMVDRTFERPREIIQFFNECLEQSKGKPRITNDTIKKAELNYSHQRLRSLYDEWFLIYPNLDKITEILINSKSPFSVDDLPEDLLSRVYTPVFDSSQTGEIQSLINDYTDNQITFKKLRINLLQIFYKVGLIGAKISPQEKAYWSFTKDPTLSDGQIKTTTKLYIHRSFHRALQIQHDK